MLMGFILHFYIIFGTNLLTQGPVQIVVFCLFQCFAEKEYQTESKWNETFGSVIFGTNVIHRNWSGRQETNEVSTGQGAHLPPGCALPPRGSTDLLLPPIYVHIPWKHPGAPRNPISLLQPFVPRISHIGAFSGAPSEGHWSRTASTSTPWPLRWCVSSLLQTFGSIASS